jgi:hypothetical protein
MSHGRHTALATRTLGLAASCGQDEPGLWATWSPVVTNPEGDMRDIKVGDYVIWRTRPNAMPVTGCKVLEFGETEDGRRFAKNRP